MCVIEQVVIIICCGIDCGVGMYIQYVFVVVFGIGIVQVCVFEYFVEEEVLLFFVGEFGNQVEIVEMILWNLVDGRIGCRDQLKYFGYCLL